MFNLDNGWVFHPNQLIIARSGKDIRGIVHNPITEPGCVSLQNKNVEVDFRIDELGVCLTPNCNLRCKYCSQSSVEGLNDLDYDLAIDTVNEVFIQWMIRHIADDEPLDKFRITISGGGEPTYNWPLFEKFVRKVHSISIDAKIPLSMAITTNGMISEPDRLDFIFQYFDSILISYDGTSLLQNKNRPCPTNPFPASIVESSIRYLSKMGKISIRTTIWPADLPRLTEILDNLVDLVENIQDVSWTIYPASIVGRAKKQHLNKEFNDNLFFEYFHRVREYAIEKYDYHDISSSAFVLKDTACFCGAFGYNCKSGWIRTDGTIVSCFDYERVDVVASLSKGELIKNNHYNDVLLEEYQRAYELCKGCLVFRFCKGGCPAKHLNNKELDKEIREWECNSNISMWKFILNELCSGRSAYGWYAVPYKEDADILLIERSSDDI